jgi:hypothetical protein
MVWRMRSEPHEQGDELWSLCAENNSPVAQVLTTIVALV